MKVIILSSPYVLGSVFVLLTTVGRAILNDNLSRATADMPFINS